MYLDLGWNDTAGHRGIYHPSDRPVRQAMRLYRGGRLIADWSDQFGSVVVPAAAGYRLDRDVDARGSFRLAARNRLPRGRPATLDLVLRRQPGAEPSQVVAASLWFSGDDGRTWRRAQLRRVGPGRYRAVLPASRLPAGGYLSLRATGRDAGASSVHQTLIRAAAIR
jgi:hypothetical protein